MTFDLNDLEAIDQATMEIHSRDGKPTGWIWTIAGPGHPQAIELSNRLGKERLARAKAQEMAWVNGRKWKGDDESPDEAMRRTAEMLVGRVLGWSPITMNGKDYPFTRDNAIALLMDPKRGDTLVSQLTDFLGDERSFYAALGDDLKAFAERVFYLSRIRKAAPGSIGSQVDMIGL